MRSISTDLQDEWAEKKVPITNFFSCLRKSKEYKIRPETAYLPPSYLNEVVSKDRPTSAAMKRLKEQSRVMRKFKSIIRSKNQGHEKFSDKFKSNLKNLFLNNESIEQSFVAARARPPTGKTIASLNWTTVTNFTMNLVRSNKRKPEARSKSFNNSSEYRNPGISLEEHKQNAERARLVIFVIFRKMKINRINKFFFYQIRQVQGFCRSKGLRVDIDKFMPLQQWLYNHYCYTDAQLRNKRFDSVINGRYLVNLGTIELMYLTLCSKAYGIFIKVLLYIGRLYASKSDFASALEILLSGIKLSSLYGEFQEIQDMLNLSAFICQRLKNSDLAIRLGMRSLEFSFNSSCKQKETMTYDTLGLIYFNIQDPKRAYYYHTMAMKGLHEPMDSMRRVIAIDSIKKYRTSTHSQVIKDNIDPFVYLFTLDKAIAKDSKR